MKRIIAVGFLSILTTGCYANPTLTEWSKGFLHARDHSGTIVVDNRSHMGVPADQLLDGWNWTAGRGSLLVALPRDHPDGASAHIRFNIMSPICAYGNCNDRRAAWVEPIRNADNSTAYCNIHFDPYWPPPASWEHTLEHEIGHCLGFVTRPYVDEYHPDYRGVMSYWDFSTQAGWWGPADVEMLAEAGY